MPGLRPPLPPPRRPARRRRPARLGLLGLAAAAAVSLAVTAVRAGAEPERIYDPVTVKARMVREFANFSEWPANTFASPTAPLVVGLVGGDSDADAIASNLRGKAAGRRPVEVRPCRSQEDLRGCHVVVFSHGAAPKARPFLAALDKQAVLTVGDGGGFLEDGGMIRFLAVNEHLTFDVNLPAIRRVGLDIHSKVLSLAHDVLRQP